MGNYFLKWDFQQVFRQIFQNFIEYNNITACRFAESAIETLKETW